MTWVAEVTSQSIAEKIYFSLFPVSEVREWFLGYTVYDSGGEVNP